jgi:pentatricopeptide repeat protein
MGALQKIYSSVIVALTSQEKWDKAKQMVDGLLSDVV